eukprot:6173331-Pleurochrysis_carterae.AAC.1
MRPRTVAGVTRVGNFWRSSPTRRTRLSACLRRGGAARPTVASGANAALTSGGRRSSCSSDGSCGCAPHRRASTRRDDVESPPYGLCTEHLVNESLDSWVCFAA